MNEELVNLDMKKCILDKWKCKLTYSFTRKDLEELEAIIDYYEQENKQLKENLFDYARLQTEIIEKNLQLDLYKSVIDEEYKYLKQEKENHFNNVKLCTTNLENLILSSALCTCDHALEILDKANIKEN